MKVRGTTVLLIVVVIALGSVAVIANFDQFKMLIGSGRSDSTQTKNKPPDEEVTSPDQEKAVDTNVAGNNINRISEIEDTERRRELSKRGYGRSNPFEPIVVSRRSRQSGPAKTSASTGESNQLPYMRLTAVLGETAIFEVDAGSKTVSVGDVVAGMNVVEIRENQVILNKGNKLYSIMLRGQLKAVPSETR